MKKLSLFLAAALVFAALPADSEVVQEVDAVGWSKIYSGNIPRAREHAREDAFDAAVTQTVQSLVPTDELVASFPLAAGTVLDRPQEYISGFRVLAEAQEGGKVRLLVRVSVDAEGVRDALAEAGLLSADNRLPQAAVLLGEKGVDGSSARSWWSPAVSGDAPSDAARTVAEQLESEGFRVVDAYPAVREIMEDPAFSSGTMDQEKALEAARRAGAGVLVFGRAEAQSAANVMGDSTKTFQGVVYLQALDAKTGQVLASARETAASVSENPEEGGARALAQAAQQAAESLAREAAVSWKNLAGSARFEISVRGIQPLSRFVSFRRDLKENTPGVSVVVPRSMD
ncbi:MAG: hypothetical protein JRI97_04685, partial [Deltaproteobacteria bacterium]|nr:hypothetical protein [Deltaproteobacteria bacterium]